MLEPVKVVLTLEVDGRRWDAQLLVPAESSLLEVVRRALAEEGLPLFLENNVAITLKRDGRQLDPSMTLDQLLQQLDSGSEVRLECRLRNGARTSEGPSTDLGLPTSEVFEEEEGVHDVFAVDDEDVDAMMSCDTSDSTILEDSAGADTEHETVEPFGEETGRPPESTGMAPSTAARPRAPAAPAWKSGQAPGAPPKVAARGGRRRGTESSKRERRSQSLDQRATVRYFNRMNPGRTFPLLVVLSSKTVEEVGSEKITQRASRLFRVEEGSVVEIEPILPGCDCYPPRVALKAGPTEKSACFHVVPRVLGKLMEPRIVVRDASGVLAEIPMEIVVARQALSIGLGVSSFFVPYFMAILRKHRLDFESQLEEGFGLYGRLLEGLTQGMTPETWGLVLLSAGVVLYLWRRPRQREVFWEFETSDPASRLAEVKSLLKAGNRELAVERLNSLLRAAPDYEPALRLCGDCNFDQGEHQEALGCYEDCIALGSRHHEDFARAASCASTLGDSRKAYDLLKAGMTRVGESKLPGSYLYNLGCYAARMGRSDEAMQYLGKAVEHGYLKTSQYCEDPDLDSLRSRADFQELVERLGRLDGTKSS